MTKQATRAPMPSEIDCVPMKDGKEWTREERGAVVGWLFESKGAELLRVVLQRVWSPDEAEEILSDYLLHLLTDGCSPFEEYKHAHPGSFVGYIKQDLKYFTLRRYKQESHLPSKSGIEVDPQTPDPSTIRIRDTVPEEIDAQARRQRHMRALHECIEELPTHLRPVVECRGIRGLSVRETSVELAMNGGTVKAYYCKAKELLRDCVSRRLGERQ